MVPNTASYPIAKNDLVFGDDFLSIYINQDKRHPNRNPKHRSKFIFETSERMSSDNIDNKDNVPVPPSSIMTDKRYTDNKYPKQHQHTQANAIYTKKSLSDTPASTTNNNEINSNKNIVKLVTTGSKIIFLEDEEDTESNDKEFSSITQNSAAAVDKNSDHEGMASEMTEDMTMPDEIKIISVSVSSSNTQSKGSSIIQAPASKLMKDEPMIDEDDEPASEPANDSINQESMRIQTIISPPHLLKSHSPMNSQSEQLNPTVIIHDHHGFHREGSARPRSVSYSSVSQTIHRQYDSSHLNSTRKNPSQFVPKLPKIYSEPSKVYSEPAHTYSQASKVYSEPAKYYSEPSKIYSEPSKVYSEPEKVYSVPSKIYSEPSKIYSEPSKFYSEPSKVYSQPSKVYGEPSKFYSLPAGTIEQPASITPTTTTTTPTITTTPSPSAMHKKIIFNLDKLPYDLLNAPVSDNTNGYLPVNSHIGDKRFHPSMPSSLSSFPLNRKSYSVHINNDQHYHNIDLVNSSMIDMIENKFQPTIDFNKMSEPSVITTTSTTTTINDELSSSSSSTPLDSHDNSDNNDDDDDDNVDPKVGYVVEGRNFRKYRVEEKTSDGFIVGEYGVVSTNDGSLRGVRYTADSNINPNLIHKALMKFLSL